MPAEANPIDQGINLRELQQQNINFRDFDDENFNNLENVDEILNDLIENLNGEVDENLLMEELAGIQDLGINVNIDQVIQRVRELQNRRNGNIQNNVNNNNINNNNNIINNVNNTATDNEGQLQESTLMLLRRTLDLQNNIIVLFFMSLLPWFYLN